MRRSEQMKSATVNLRPLTRADLPVIRPWFEDPDTRRFLGGPDWPAAMLEHSIRAVATMFPGARQTGAHHYLALTADAPSDTSTAARLTAALSTAARALTGRSPPRRSMRALAQSRSRSTPPTVAKGSRPP